MCNNHLLVVLIWLSICYSTRLTAQGVNIEVQQFGVEDGLLHRNVGLFKDSKGFLWLFGNLGLQRYDGYSFKNYGLGEENGFRTNYMGELANGDFWLLRHAEPKDFLFFNAETGVVSRSSPDFLQTHVGAWFELLKTHDLAMSTGQWSDGFFLQSETGEITAFSFDHGSYPIPIPKADEGRLLHVSAEGELWIKPYEREEIIRINARNALPEDWTWSELSDRSFTKWNGGYHWSKWEKNKSVEEVDFKLYAVSAAGALQLVYQSPAGYNFHQFLSGRAWSQAADGWHLFDVATLEEITLLRADYGPELFGYVDYLVFTSDEPARAYTSSQFGFNIIDIKSNRFTTYFNKTAAYPLPFSNSVRGIYADDEFLYFTCENQGLVKQSLASPEDFEVYLRNLGTKEMHRHEGVGILPAGDGQLWVSRGTSRLGRFDPGSFEPLEEVFLEPQEPQNWGAFSWTLYKEEGGCIWFTNQITLRRYCDGELSIYPFGLANDLTVLQILPKDEQILWLCSDQGLLEFDIPSEKIAHTYSRKQTGEYALPTTNIKHLFVDENGDKWMASDRGLIYWSASTGEKRLFSRLDGLANNNLYAVYPDEHGRLWLSSDYGIMAFDKSTYHVTNYLPKDGIGQKEFNRVAHFQAADGRIYFGGLDGITSFHPDDFLQETEGHVKMLLSELEVFDGEKEVLIDERVTANRGEAITINPNDRYVKLSFSLPTFEDTEKILYGWKMDGVYDDWTYQKENFLQFAALPYGSHELRIKGQSSAAGWSPHELSIRIDVLKPFYLRTWFLLAAFVAIVLGVVAFFRIRTQVLQAEIKKATATIQEQAEELRQLDRLKSRFFANVSHELRTPLSLMLGPIKRLLGKSSPDREERKLLEFLQRNTLHLKGLVNEILDLSKLESGKLTLEKHPVLFQRYLEVHMSQFYSIGGSESVVVDCEVLLEDNLAILLDSGKFEKVINNFLSNAIKFTPPAGRVVLSAIDEGNTLLISVRDNGRGISEQDLPHVFDRFFQSKDKDAPTEGGTGIGLSMSKELAELMGGAVWAESTLGQGSTFFFRMPKELTTEEVVMLEPTEEFAAAAGAKAVVRAGEGVGPVPGKHILIVEDNADLRGYYQILLSDYELTLRPNGRQALDFLAGGRLPDLIISDLMMPIMDGMQLLGHLKSDDRYRHLPVIMLTAKTNQQVKIKALRFGIDDYLTKPFDDEELRVRTHNLLTHQAGRAEVTEMPADAPGKPVASGQDLQWLEALEDYIREHLDAAELAVPEVAKHFAMSESTLSRQLKKLTGLTPGRYLREVRLNQARFLLEGGHGFTIAEVAYRVGFTDPAAFTRSFKQRFGVTPTAVAQ